MKDSSIDYRYINNWFAELSPEEQELVITEIDKGKPNFTTFIEDLGDSKLIATYNQLVNHMESGLRENKTADTLNSEIVEMGLTESFFRGKLMMMVSPYLKIYHSANLLRSLDDKNFQLIIRTLIYDVYVNRKYRNSKLLQSELQLQSYEDAKDINWLVKIVLRNFYEQNVSYDEFREFLINEIGLSIKKVDYFVQVITECREKLEVYFLFEQLRAIRNTFDEHSTASEE